MATDPQAGDLEHDETAYRRAFNLFTQFKLHGQVVVSTKEIGKTLLALGSPFADDVDMEEECWGHAPISFEEFAAEEIPMDERPVDMRMVRALLAAASRNGLGGDDASEREGCAAWSDAVDGDGDGKVSREEWVARFGNADRFDAYDADHNGNIPMECQYPVA